MNTRAHFKKWLTNLSRQFRRRRKALQRPFLQKFKYSAGEQLLKKGYIKFYSRALDTRNPQLFSEKMFCKMIAINRQNDPLLTMLADKHRARHWVESRIGSEHMVRLFWQGDNPNQIPFDTLPERCVIKTNHGSGQNIIKNGPIDRAETCEKLKEWLAENYYWVCREHQYYDIPPTILVEELLIEEKPGGLLDYRFWCFDGRAKIIQTNNVDRSVHLFYDTKWNVLDIKTTVVGTVANISPPVNLEKMLEIAEKLSAGFDFVRVDLYNIEGRIVFGEMTFTPRAGRFKFKPQSWDLTLGKLWTMDPKYQIH